MAIYSPVDSDGSYITSNAKCNENIIDFLPSWNHKTVLLVDDQIDVLITIKTALQTCGYTVDTFNDPVLAAEHLSLHSHEYGIVISGMMMMMMTMTFMSGMEFLKRVQAVNPEIVTFIITSSDSIKDTNKDMLYDSTLIEVDGIIQKPILSNDLCRMVERSSQQN